MNASTCIGQSGSCRRLPSCITREIYVNPLGTRNVRGINGTGKREEVIFVFRKRKFELLILTKTKLKGNGEVSWCGINGIIAGVQEMKRVKEDVAVLLNDVYHCVVMYFGCVSSRVFWFKLLKFVWWWVTAPMKE